MATAQLDSRPSDTGHRRPFTAWVKRLANLKGSDKAPGNKASKKNGGIPLTNSKNKKGTHGNIKNNPYPESGHLRAPSAATSENGHLSFSTPVSQPRQESFESIPRSMLNEKEAQSNSNRSAAPTVATNSETVHSDAGHSKAFTATTAGGAFSTDGAGGNSTFSSPNQSQRSLTTTLTTIQSASPGNTLQQYSQPPNSSHLHASNLTANSFTHQYPTSPSPSHAASAIPPHMTHGNPQTYNSATAGNLLTDDASILTLASSSKRRRRSMDTDASVRALAPSSVWGGSRESLPLSVLSGHAEERPVNYASQSRPSIGGLASAERASVYSSQGVSGLALASDRNSTYTKPKDPSDAKSLRSITNLNRTDDARSLNMDAKSFVGTDVASLRNYEGSIRSGALGHGRNDSIPGSIGSPLASPGIRGGPTGGLSRRSSDWQEMNETEEAEKQEQERKERAEVEDEAKHQ